MATMALLVALTMPAAAMDPTPPARDKLWTGAGDGTSWADAANWLDRLVPGPADEVVLDHSMVTAAYVVVLPRGTVTTTVARLTLDPAGGAKIALVLGGNNTASPGLRVGDGSADTDDIVLEAGAEMVNASDASDGNGIEVITIGNGTVRIANGARYVHATRRGSSGIAPLLSTAPGTERGEFSYEVPGSGVFNIAASGRTYGDLTLSKVNGVSSYGALGSSPLTVRGNLTLRAGVTLSSGMTGPLVLGGDLVNQGGPLILPSNQPVVFGGEKRQAVLGGFLVIVRDTTVVTRGTTLALRNSWFTNMGTLVVEGALELAQGFTPAGTGTCVFAPGSRGLRFTNALPTEMNDAFWPDSAGPDTVEVIGPGSVTLPGSRRMRALVLAGGDVVTNDDTLRIDVGGTVERTNGWVRGSLEKIIDATATTARFEIGTESGGAPVDLAFDHVLEPGTIVVTCLEGDHPQIATSGLDASRSVNRFWRLGGGLAFDSGMATFHFQPQDLDAGADPDRFTPRRWDGWAWDVSGARERTDTDTETEIFGLGEFALGESVRGASTVTIDDVRVVERSAGTTFATFTVNVTPPSGNAIQLDFATRAGTALAPDDYADTTGTLVIPGDVTSMPIRVAVWGDPEEEPDETFELALSHVDGAGVADSLGVCTILNDDAPSGRTPTSALGFASGPVTQPGLALGPNPARRSLTVEFALPADAATRLTIVDVQGRVIATLADAPFAAGRHRATWNGRGDRGAAPGGIYFVRCETRGTVLTRRFVWLP